MRNDKNIIFTTSWDDGHSNDIKLAKILDNYGIKGTFYIPIVSIGKWLSKEILIEISRNHEIGCHTITHCSLTEVTIKKAKEEIKKSKDQLENILNKKINCFCYPKGKYNEKIKDIVKNCGFICARTIERFNFNIPNDLFEMGTTIQTLNFKRDILKVLKITKSPIISINSLNWLYLAKFMFDRMLVTGGVYHLWGHSWNIERRNFWEKLENFLDYVAHRKNVKYLTNGELARELMGR